MPGGLFWYDIGMEESILVIVKPDGMVKGLAGYVLTRFEATGLRMVAARMAKVTRELAVAHYYHLREKPFYEELIRFIMGEFDDNQDNVLAFAFIGENAVKKARAIAGATNPEEADPTSIRGSYGRITTKGVYENVIHVSSNASEAEREIKLWFQPGEIIVDLYPTKEVIEENKKARVWALNEDETYGAKRT